MYDEAKFKEFNRLLQEARADLVVVNHPQVLGDNYEELVENLNRLSTAGMYLSIVPLKNRTLFVPSPQPD